MLLHEFFHIHDLEAVEGKVKASLHINPSHPIFEGHFPGQPVVPGVTMMLMVRSLLETQLQPLRLVRADNVKFLSLINPQETPVVQAEISYVSTPEGQWKVTARLFNEPIVYFKYAGLFVDNDVQI
jgi:3-hydroxyacyl-[acyl-carrier-protein] dehydratase